MSDVPRDTSGMAAAFEMAMAEHEADAAQGADQPSLFGRDVIDPDGVGDAPDVPAGPRGVGRPAGSRNKSTDQWRRFFLTRYGSPMQVLAELWSVSPSELQKELGGAITAENKDGCTKLDALRVIIHAASIGLPYMHQKQATAIDTGGQAMMMININTGDGMGGQTFDIQPIEEIEENQALSAEGHGLSEPQDRNE